MCCLVLILALLGPRAGIVVWWLFDMGRWETAFPSFLWPLLGFILLPWTTLAYVFVFPGGIEGLDLVLLIIAVVVDIVSLGGGWRNRGRRW